jgi:predicted tellurium resistance membrane protein TerC
MEKGVVLAAVFVGLFGFGVGYNVLIAWMEREGYDRGYTAFLVVAGVVATLSGSALVIGLEAALIVGLCFTASGLPMIAGSMLRSNRQRKIDEEKARQVARESLEQGEG